MSEKNHKVMILDDDFMSLLLTEDVLLKADFSVVRMSAPHGCLAKLDYEKPDVLLVDITMKHLAVDDLLDSIQDSLEYNDLVIVLYSDMKAQALEKICHAKDINGYFCKSMEVQKLPDFLKQFL